MAKDTMAEFDFVIIGSGSAAFAAAAKANELGARTAVIERGTIGGTCVNVGCVPSKHLLRLGELYYYGRHHDFSALTGGEHLKLDFARAIRQKDEVVEALRRDKYEAVLTDLPNVTLTRGSASFVGPHEVEIDSRRITGDKFLIATGSLPFVPPIDGLNDVGYLTNVEIMELKSLPDSLLVLGAGALGLEFAQMYAHFGARVCVIQKGPQILPRIEPEIAAALERYLVEEGIEICTNAGARSARIEGNRKVLTVSVGEEMREYAGEQLLVATGRTPNTAGLGLEAIGVELGKKGAIAISDEQRTSLSHVYAAGDVRGEPMLETTAAKEGTIAAENALSGAHRKMDYSSVPFTVFTYPQVAQVGLTDAEATARGFECACRVLDFAQVPKAQVIKETRGIIKMVAEADTGRVLGVSIAAPEAGDLIHEATLAVKFKLTIYDLIDTVHVFPTLGESIKLVAQSYLRDISKLPCCTD